MVVDKGMVSIVVPVYKAESTIKRCVDSILAQTYLNFELLLVDDGSPDNSGRICDEYALSDARVKVFHKENGGVSSARNLGIDNAQGEYLVFVDSDDYVGQDYLLHMLQVESSQLVVGGVVRSVEGKDDEKIVLNSRKVVVPDDLLKLWSRENNLLIYSFPYAKLFFTKMVKSFGIRFDTNLFFLEDFSFVMDYMAKIESFDLLQVSDYVYCVSKKDACRGVKYKMSAQQLITHYEAVERRISAFDKSTKEKLVDIRNNVNSRLLRNYKFYLNEIVNKSSFINQIEQLKNWIHRKDFLSSALKVAGIKKRMSYMFLIRVPVFSYFLMRRRR